MAEPGEKIDPYWEEIMILTERLTSVAGRFFKGRGCSDVEDILPGTGMDAIGLVAKTIGDLVASGYWRPGVGEDPFPIAYTALKRDFLDLIKSSGYVTTETTDGQLTERIPARSSGFEQAEAALLVNSLRRPLKNDQQAIDFLAVWLVEGFESNDDIAGRMGISEQEVINIKRRLTSKIHLWERLWGRKDRQ